MEKLTKEQQSGISELLHYIQDEKVVQTILETLGKENWTRGILSNCCEFLTEEQEDLYESLGGGYTCEELDLIFEIDDINYEISKILKEQGVTKYLYENEEYIDEIREGRIVCEGIDVEIIKKMILMKREKKSNH